MEPYTIAILIYCDIHSTRDALTEDKYKDLGIAFMNAGFRIKSVSYNDEQVNEVFQVLSGFDAVLVWVNPVEQGHDRKILDSMLLTLSNNGCFVSAHPEIILKMGTKDVLYKTKALGWVGDVNLYSNLEDFVLQFHQGLNKSRVKILKRYRGNGGNGVFKIIKGQAAENVTVIHAKNSDEARVMSRDDFNNEFASYLATDGLLIEQEWNENLVNGMVRCYLCGNKVAGFGYQEINALYELKVNDDIVLLPPSKRYYFTENCGLFSDLKAIMENNWVPKLQETLSISAEMLPVIWDADFFINDSVEGGTARYSLCEINVSSVSPFPPSAIKFIIQETGNRIRMKNIKSSKVL